MSIFYRTEYAMPKFSDHEPASASDAKPDMARLKKKVSEGFDRETLLRLMQMDKAKDH